MVKYMKYMKNFVHIHSYCICFFSYHGTEETSDQNSMTWSKKTLLVIPISLQMNESIWIIFGLLFDVFWSCIYEYI